MDKKEFYNDENLVIFSGRLTQDPSLKYTRTKLPVLRFTIAVNHYIRDKKDTLFLPIVVFSDLAIEVSSLIKKGTKVKVEGKLVNRVIKTNDEQHKFFEVIANKIEVFKKKED